VTDARNWLSAYEMMIRNRKNACDGLKPENEKQAEEIFKKWATGFRGRSVNDASQRFGAKHMTANVMVRSVEFKELVEAHLLRSPHVPSPQLPRFTRAMSKRNVDLRRVPNHATPNSAQSAGCGSNTITSSGQ